MLLDFPDSRVADPMPRAARRMQAGEDDSVPLVLQFDVGLQALQFYRERDAGTLRARQWHSGIQPFCPLFRHDLPCAFRAQHETAVGSYPDGDHLVPRCPARGE